MAADKTKILSAEQEAKLRQPIEEHMNGIQQKIDALRENGTNRVIEIQNNIDTLKRDRVYTQQEKQAKLQKYTAELEKAKAVEGQNKEQISKLIAEGESYLKQHFEKEYYAAVAASCKQEKILAKERYAAAVGSTKLLRISA